MTDGSRIALLEVRMKYKEGENLEFKSARGGFHSETLAKYCCALANEGGGRIILGVTDARPRQVVGTKAFEQPERTRKGLCEKIPLSIDFEEINHPDCAPDSRVLVFNAPPRPLGIPIKYDGRYWMRKEDSLVEMSEDRLREIFAESGHDFSADPCPGLTKLCLRLTPAPEGPSKGRRKQRRSHCNVSLPRPDRNFTSLALELWTRLATHTSASHDGPSGAACPMLTPTMGFRPWLPTSAPPGAAESSSNRIASDFSEPFSSIPQRRCHSRCAVNATLR